MNKTGSQITLDILQEEGVDVLFAIPGGSVIPLFDTFYEGPVRCLLMRHEQAAGHAADGYARATGKVGVCIATSGPGATNLVTALATAYMDSIPMVAITGQVKTHLIGNDAFQEADTTGITRPVTKHNYLVKDVADLPRILREAFYIARTGRPGPVVVDLPVDVTLSELPEEEIAKAQINLPGYKPRYEGNARQVRLAAEAIDAAERPVLYVGGGVITSGASAQLAELAHKANLPVTTTLMAMGAFPETDPLALNMLGMHGTVYANYAVTECDLLIAMAARFDDRITGKIEEFAPNAKVLHIDIDPTSIGKCVQVDIPVVGDAKQILIELNKLVKSRPHTAWLEQIGEWKRQYPLAYDKGGLKPQYVVEQICEASHGDAIICTEVGQHQMWAAQYFTFTKPRTFITSGGLGTMGYGFPAAIGAQMGRPDKLVFDIAGDGSIQMNIQEMCTVVQHNLPVKIAVINNGYLGMVRQWQELFFKKRYAMSVLHDGNPDFVRVAEAYGMKGITVKEHEQVRPAIDEAIAHNGPVLLDFHVDPEENVYPMVPAGEAINRMIGGMA